MNLRFKITAICALVFFTCGLFFGILKQSVSMREARWGAENRLHSALVATANMASADKNFVASEKLEKARERVKLKTLDVEFFEADKFKKRLFHASIAEKENFNFEGEYAVLENDNVIEVRGEFHSLYMEDLRGNFLASASVFAGLGALFGILVGLISSSIIIRRIDDLHEGLFSKNKDAKGIQISEFSDLSDLAELLREIDEARTVRESLNMENFLSGRRLCSTALDALAARLKIEECGLRASYDFAKGRSDGAFARSLGNGKILYGRLEKQGDELEKLSESILAAELSLKYMCEFPESEAFEKVSKIFNLSHWCVLDFSGAKIIKRGWENNAWSEDEFSKDLPQVFSTSKLGEVLRFYTHTNLCGDSGDRLDAVMRLSPESEGGLFIHLEKI